LRTPDLETPLDAPARSMDVAAYGSNDVRAVIDNALRAAGLMR
jgi:hypothetical protein